MAVIEEAGVGSGCEKSCGELLYEVAVKACTAPHCRLAPLLRAGVTLQLTRSGCAQFPKEALHNRPALLRDFVVTGKVKVGQLPVAVLCQCRAVTPEREHGSSHVPQLRVVVQD